MELTVIDPLYETESNYRFYEDEGGGKWKVLLVLRENRPPTVETSAPLAPVALNVVVTASPIDDEGKALRDAEDRVIVSDSMSYTFNEVELVQLDFDPMDRINQLVKERIESVRVVTVSNSRIVNLAADWATRITV